MLKRGNRYIYIHKLGKIVFSFGLTALGIVRSCAQRLQFNNVKVVTDEID